MESLVRLQRSRRAVQAAHYLLLTTHYSLLTTHDSRLTTHYSLPPPRGPPPTRPQPRPADDERAFHFRKGVETASGTTSHLSNLLLLPSWEVGVAALSMDAFVTKPWLALPDVESFLPRGWPVGMDNNLQARQDKLEQLLQWLCQLQLLHKDVSSGCYSRTLHCPPLSVQSLWCILRFDIVFQVRARIAPWQLLWSSCAYARRSIRPMECLVR
jgi:hypothetical protein